MSPRTVILAGNVGATVVLWALTATALWSLWARHLAPPFGLADPGLSFWGALVVVRPLVWFRLPEREPDATDLFVAGIQMLFATAVLLASEVAP